MKAARHPHRYVMKGTIKGAMIAPTLEPATKMPVASARSCFGNHSVAGPRARFCRLRCKVSSRLATLRALPRWPGQTAGDWSVGPACSGRKISHRFEPGRIFTGLYQSWSRRDQPTDTLLLSARGYVCYPVSTPASLTLLSSSLYTQIYSLCRSTRPKIEPSGQSKPERQM